MPPISKYKLNQEIIDKLFNLFFEIIGKNQSKNEFDLIIYDIFSSTERVMIAKRIAIMYLLLKDINYKIICDKLRVSPATILKFRGSLENSKGVLSRFNKILKNEKIKELFEEVYLFLQKPGTPGTSWSISLQNRLEFERKKREGI